MQRFWLRNLDRRWRALRVTELLRDVDHVAGVRADLRRPRAVCVGNGSVDTIVCSKVRIVVVEDEDGIRLRSADGRKLHPPRRPRNRDAGRGRWRERQRRAHAACGKRAPDERTHEVEGEAPRNGGNRTSPTDHDLTLPERPATLKQKGRHRNVDTTPHGTRRKRLSSRARLRFRRFRFSPRLTPG